MHVTQLILLNGKKEEEGGEEGRREGSDYREANQCYHLTAQPNCKLCSMQQLLKVAAVN